MNTKFEEYRKNLQAENLTSFEDLENLLKPLIKEAFSINVLEESEQQENNPLISHFGGNPYFEIGEEWPKSENGNYQTFMFQIYNDGTINLPENIKLIQFFYDWELFPCYTDEDGWQFKIYEKLNPENTVKIEQPVLTTSVDYCEVTFNKIKSLPNWDSIDLYSEKAFQLCCILNDEHPYDSYINTVEKLVGTRDFESQIGGYAHWLQGDLTPPKENNKPMDLLFQIDSEHNAGYMWGDIGLAYVFYDAVTNHVEFILQDC
ncbi:hypothetical protein ASE40_03260 [Flavobacterium sp. Root935]|uniref:DUF1963 domain-containing protein n=1 Tax=Flavobacterium sp. Root935 TaxID=1736610 RepID=UPI00070DC5A3|nr:DUF1963 domain-containing protein [Flavobacterium sp. Root935]KRD62823.1 hypothetical protein ASE40_03260 [Flavobacterium sp. Root935]